MDREREIIRLIQRELSSTDSHLAFTTDAQVFNMDGKEFLFTTDEYSEEDFFRDDHPGILAWNLVTATLTDILAAGGIPLVYGHSMTVPPSWDDDYVIEFSKSIKACLDNADSKFIGGDTGFSSSWKYTGIAIGRMVRPLSRSGARSGDIIYMTGKVGAGNLEAALKIYGPELEGQASMKYVRVRFAYRQKEAETMRKFATSCTDSSDGIMKALMNLSSSSKLGFLCSGLPYLKEGLEMCALLHVDKKLLCLGEAGEYELVFTIRPEEEMEFLREAKQQGLSISRIGIMTDSGTHTIIEEGKRYDFSNFELHARDYDSVGSYISALKEYLDRS